ncbi:Rec8 like protein-domain-containing protein [Pelagophyceae sp. CCMP2097]|nr:Rec8 like protein-domain-containing protein [Pelagophyceae sp. CCMP2097]
MFYSSLILQKSGPYAHIWLAATFEKKLSKQQVFTINIEQSVDSIINPTAPLALRLSANLLLGVVRIYVRKTQYLQMDCNEAMTKMQNAFQPSVVDLPDDSAAAAASITVANFDDLDIGLDVDAGAHFDVAFGAQAGRGDRFGLGDDEDEWAAAATHAIARRRDITLADDVFDGGFDAETPSGDVRRPAGRSTAASSVELARDDDEADARERRSRGTLSQQFAASPADGGPPGAASPLFDDDDGGAAAARGFADEGLTDLAPLAPGDELFRDDLFHDEPPPPPPQFDDASPASRRPGRASASLGGVVDDLAAIDEDRPLDEDRPFDDDAPMAPPEDAEEAADAAGAPDDTGADDAAGLARKRRRRAAVVLEDADLSLSGATIKGWLDDYSALIDVRTVERVAGDFAAHVRRGGKRPAARDTGDAAPAKRARAKKPAAAGDAHLRPAGARRLDVALCDAFAARARFNAGHFRLNARGKRARGAAAAADRDGDDEDARDAGADADDRSHRSSRSEEDEPEAARGPDAAAAAAARPAADDDGADRGAWDDEAPPPPRFEDDEEPRDDEAPPSPPRFDDGDERPVSPFVGGTPIDDLEPLSLSETAARARGVEREWHPNTVKVMEMLREGLLEAEALSFDVITGNADKRTAVGAFVELLHLKSWDFIQLRQAEPYADIAITRATCFADAVPAAA